MFIEKDIIDKINFNSNLNKNKKIKEINFAKFNEFANSV